jgi:hypothetical protein
VCRFSSPKEIRGIINRNPELWLNQLVYAILILIMLFFGIVKASGQRILKQFKKMRLHVVFTESHQMSKTGL